MAHAMIRGWGRKQQAQQTIKPYMNIRLDDLLDLSRTPGAVCQSIQSRNAPDVVAGIEVVMAAC